MRCSSSKARPISEVYCDDLGRISNKTETVDGVTTNYDYFYDLSGRLTDVNKDNTPFNHYEYDSNGNRTLHSDGVTSTAGTYDNQDRLTNYGNLNFNYTVNGELLSKTDTTNNETTVYSYDVLGNLLSVGLPDGTAIDYITVTVRILIKTFSKLNMYRFCLKNKHIPEFL